MTDFRINQHPIKTSSVGDAKVPETDLSAASPQLTSIHDEINPVSDPLVQSPQEIGGPAGPEPTRYGDWEVKGRCSDF